MDILEKKEYYTVLFDFYESLFTEKQQAYFKEYYFFDNSLSEIAKNYGISRAAVYDIINKMHDALNEYEKKLGLYEKYQKRNDLIDIISNILYEDKDIIVEETPVVKSTDRELKAQRTKEYKAHMREAWGDAFDYFLVDITKKYLEFRGRATRLEL